MYYLNCDDSYAEVVARSMADSTFYTELDKIFDAIETEKILFNLNEIRANFTERRLLRKLDHEQQKFIRALVLYLDHRYAQRK